MKVLQNLVVGIIGTVAAALLLFVAATISGTVIFWLWSSLGPKFFSFMPAVWLNISWGETVLMSWFAALVGGVLFKTASVSTS